MEYLPSFINSNKQLRQLPLNWQLTYIYRVNLTSMENKANALCNLTNTKG